MVVEAWFFGWRACVYWSWRALLGLWWQKAFVFLFNKTEFVTRFCGIDHMHVNMNLFTVFTSAIQATGQNNAGRYHNKRYDHAQTHCQSPIFNGNSLVQRRYQAPRPWLSILTEPILAVHAFVAWLTIANKIVAVHVRRWHWLTCL
jgi:hypothetical protein